MRKNHLLLLRVCLQSHQPRWNDICWSEGRGLCRGCDSEESTGKLHIKRTWYAFIRVALG